MSVPPTLTLPGKKKKKPTEKGNRCELGCRGAQLGLLPQHDVLGCMPGVVGEPSPAAESSLKLTSGFFAATLALLVWEGMGLAGSCLAVWWVWGCVCGCVCTCASVLMGTRGAGMPQGWASA